MSVSYVRCKNLESEEICNVETGFSVVAFFFPTLWLFFYRFWWLAIGLTVVHFMFIGTLFDVIQRSGFSADNMWVVYITGTIYSFSSIYLSINGYKLRLKKLIKQGFILEKMVNFYQILKIEK